MNDKLPGNYIAGFVDGEGCFALKYRRDQQKNKRGDIKEYYYWGAEFAVVLHPLDEQLLKDIQHTLGVGKISHKKTGDQVRFSVQKIRDLKDVIIPFFQEHSLRGIKVKDFKLWSIAVTLIAKHKNKTVRGYPNPMADVTHRELENLKNQINVIKRKGK